LSKIGEILDFISSAKQEGAIYHADDASGTPSAYHEFDLTGNFKHFLRLSYHPDIPSVITAPTSKRLSYWSRKGDNQAELPRLWDLLGGLEEPFILRGVEVIENTPDLNTGGYYKYDLDRTLILLNYRGRYVLISLSKQKGPSEVGKKGVVLGEDDDWNYLYSGEKGLNKTGLGWVSSYMYDSYSVIVYYEPYPGKPLIKCGVFKWLRAGWRNINMVKKYHIHRGLLRFAETYREIFDNPSLPDTSVLAETWSRISGLDLNTLRDINRGYLQGLAKRYKKDKSMSSKWVAGLLTNDAYVESLDRNEMATVIMLEYMKSLLGKRYEIDLKQL
jgi:hypothetical protein